MPVRALDDRRAKQSAIPCGPRARKPWPPCRRNYRSSVRWQMAPGRPVRGGDPHRMPPIALLLLPDLSRFDACLACICRQSISIPPIPGGDCGGEVGKPEHPRRALIIGAWQLRIAQLAKHPADLTGADAGNDLFAPVNPKLGLRQWGFPAMGLLLQMGCGKHTPLPDGRRLLSRRRDLRMVSCGIPKMERSPHPCLSNISYL